MEVTVTLTLTEREYLALRAALIRYEKQSASEGFGGNALKAISILAKLREAFEHGKK
jgi:hypothetical protein